MGSLIEYMQGMKRVAATEYAGPCPFCGDGSMSSDRFHVWTDNAKGRYWCRQCGAKGDGIQLLRDAKGMSFHEACSALGIQPKGSGGTGWSGSAARASATRPAASGAAPSPAKAQAEERKPTSGEATYPGTGWMAAAARFLDRCQTGIRPDEEPAIPFGAVMALQVKRGISPFWCTELDFGYNAADRWERATEWGLPADVNPSGKIRLPRGVVIAVRRPVGIVSLVVRLDEAEDNCRFREIRGGGRGLGYLAGEAGKPLFLLESALDAVVLAECAGDIATGLAMCGNTKGIDAYAKDIIKKAPCVLICPDRDEAGVNGTTTWGKILAEVGVNAIVATPKGKGVKDIGEQHTAHMELERKAPSVRRWAERWIEYAMQKKGHRA